MEPISGDPPLRWCLSIFFAEMQVKKFPLVSIVGRVERAGTGARPLLGPGEILFFEFAPWTFWHSLKYYTGINALCTTHNFMESNPRLWPTNKTLNNLYTSALLLTIRRVGRGSNWQADNYITHFRRKVRTGEEEERGRGERRRKNAVNSSAPTTLRAINHILNPCISLKLW